MKLSKSNEKVFNQALQADRAIPGYFARSVAVMHRSSSAGQQAAIWNAIVEAKRVTQFNFVNGALVAQGE